MIAPASSAETRLLTAIIWRAWLDVDSCRAAVALDALDYIDGPNFDADCHWLDINPASVRGRVQEKLMTQRIFTPDEVAALHERYYVTGRDTIQSLAVEHHVSPGTLYRAFSQAGLPTRRRTKPKHAETPFAPAAPTAGPSLNELTRVLAGIVDTPNVKTIRVTFEFEIAEQENPS